MYKVYEILFSMLAKLALLLFIGIHNHDIIYGYDMEHEHVYKQEKVRKYFWGERP